MQQETNNYDEQKNVIPEYSDVKKSFFQEYYQAKLCLSNYMLKPDPKNENACRQSLFILSHSLSFKTYVLDEDVKEEKDFKNYFNRFLKNPQEFYNFSLHSVFSICTLLMEKLGFFDIENSSPYKSQAYKEVS